MKKKLLILLLCLSLFGCKGETSDIPSQDEVLIMVQECVPSESYVLKEVQSLDTTPKKDIYIFKSEERDLEFEAVSTLSQIGIDASQTSFYHDEMYCDYLQRVKDLYQEEIWNILSNSSLIVDVKKKWINIDTEEDVQLAAQILNLANCVVKEELQYNTESYLLENPIERVYVMHYTSEDRKNWDIICSVDINGVTTEEEILNRIQESFKQ